MINLPSGLNINNLIDHFRNVSWEACETLLYYSKILKDTTHKSNIIKNENDEDPVTLADLKVNELIIKSINNKYEDINWEILSEESVKSSILSCDNNVDWTWVLDPLDGTKDFIQGTSNYAMHLALNYKKKPYLGFVLIPEKYELWIADGKNVWFEKKNGLKTQPTFSECKILKEMTLVTSKNHRNQTLQSLIQKIDFRKVIVMGSIGCKIAAIVRGEADIYISLSLPGNSSPKDWDFAAPQAILKSAGGAITDIDNQELTYGKSNYQQGGIIVASNDYKNHGKICLEIKQIIKKYNLYPF